MTQMRKLEEQVGAWPHVSVHPHRFGGREFRFGNAELGHAHTGGAVDIPFPRAVRDALWADGLVEVHRWVPNSGWTTFQVRSEGDLKHALWLMRLSYLRYALKTASEPERDAGARWRGAWPESPSGVAAPAAPTRKTRMRYR